MTESQFLSAVEDTLAQIEAAVDAADIGADCSISGLVLNIDLDEGGRIVVNAQAPLQQLWLASRSGGMHFAFDGTNWLDTRSGVEFFEALSLAVSGQLGSEVRLRPA